MKYLNVTQVLRIHARSIEQFGGDPTIRDLGMLESAVAQPRAGFGG
jgi:death-on-curing protein